MKLYIIAPTYNAFRDYCWRQGVPLDGSAVYVSSPHVLDGLRLNSGQLRFVPGWRHLAQARDIEVAAHHAVSRTLRK